MNFKHQTNDGIFSNKAAENFNLPKNVLKHGSPTLAIFEKVRFIGKYRCD